MSGGIIVVINSVPYHIGDKRTHSYVQVMPGFFSSIVFRNDDAEIKLSINCMND